MRRKVSPTKLRGLLEDAGIDWQGLGIHDRMAAFQRLGDVGVSWETFKVLLRQLQVGGK